MVAQEEVTPLVSQEKHIDPAAADFEDDPLTREYLQIIRGDWALLAEDGE